MKLGRDMAVVRKGQSKGGAKPAAEAADASIAQHVWFNILVVGGSDAEVMRLHRSLTHAQPLPWRSAEDVEREVAYLAVTTSGRRVEALNLEDVLAACERVENRHMIEDGAVSRHFRHLWHTSSAYCKQFMRGLLALKPGEVAANARTVAVGGLFREGFSLTRAALPPYRVLQGSYRYAGRHWCLRHWGTPEDARLVASRFERVRAGQRLAVYEFETVEGSPTGALQRLCERNPRLDIACVSVDADSGHRRAYIGSGRGMGMSIETLPTVSMVQGGFTGSAYLETSRVVRRLVLARLESGTQGKTAMTPNTSVGSATRSQVAL